MSEPNLLHIASALVAWSIRWQIISLFAGLFLVMAQSDTAVSAPTTLTGLVIAVSLGMLAVLTWTVKELLRINERHADNVRLLAARIRADGEEISDAKDK